jgi:hypothetical protein
MVFKAVSDLYTTSLPRRLFTLKCRGSYLNKIMLIHVAIPVKKVLLLIIVCNLMLLPEYVICQIQDEYKVHLKNRKFRPVQQKCTVSVTKCYHC